MLAIDFNGTDANFGTLQFGAVQNLPWNAGWDMGSKIGTRRTNPKRFKRSKKS